MAIPVSVDPSGNISVTGGGGGTVPSAPGSIATNTGANNFAPIQQTSTNAAVQLIAARPTRRGASIVNTDSNNTVWLGGAGVTTVTGMPLAPKSSLNITATSAVYIIDNGSHAVVGVWDEYD